MAGTNVTPLESSHLCLSSMPLEHPTNSSPLAFHPPVTRALSEIAPTTASARLSKTNARMASRNQSIPDQGYVNRRDDSFSRTSIASSIYKYRLENGRTYHAYRDGQYWGPNDEEARYLDVISIIGTDLSPIQPETKPPNLIFEIDDCCSDWVYPKNHFDYIHVRQMYGSIADWHRFYKDCYDHLTPGGYIEQAELNPVLKSDDGSIVPGDVLDQCGTLAVQAGISLGSSLEVEKSMQDDIARAGFTEVVKTTYKWPVGAWSNDPRLKELGKWNLLHWQQGLESWTLRSFTKRMGVNSSHHFFRPLTRGSRGKKMGWAYRADEAQWSYEAVKKWNADVHRTLKERKHHAYQDV
ncbi:MAG: hypothetical protein LQ341_005506, partial [Variospora aurantia]